MSKANPVPADFAIAVTVLPGSESDADLRPVRYVIQPDSVLRAAIGAGVSLDVLPRRTRRLTRAQMSAIYSHAVREGLDQGLGGESLTRGVTPRPDSEETLIVVELTAHEARRATVYRSDDQSDGAWQLVNLLGEFARVR
ncbi:MAG: hypothetical protein Phyf2KO_22010 [Phycisphaerales bacterium]